MNRAAADAAERFGAGTGAVRTIAGQMRMHLDLEERFAAFKHADAALLFQSGFTANAGTVAAILGPDDVIVSDRLNHASIIDGARLSKAEIKVFEHRDAADAERLLLRRSCKVLAHEMAHMFGIEHCIYFHCLMNGSNHLEESDARPMHLCPVDLRKLKNGEWKATLPLAEGKHEYRYLVDGQWRDDPNCRTRIPNAFGGENCVCIVT